MTTKHTPGPWEAKQSANGGIRVSGLNDASVQLWGVPLGVHDWPNALLIAAAPELLEACQLAFTYLDHTYPNTESAVMSRRTAQSAIKAAIAKAEGRL